MHLFMLLFVFCLILGFSPILATSVIQADGGTSQKAADAAVQPQPSKLDMYIDPDTMDIHEQPEGFDKAKK